MEEVISLKIVKVAILILIELLESLDHLFSKFSGLLFWQWHLKNDYKHFLIILLKCHIKSKINISLKILKTLVSIKIIILFCFPFDLKISLMSGLNYQITDWRLRNTKGFQEKWFRITSFNWKASLEALSAFVTVFWLHFSDALIWKWNFTEKKKRRCIQSSALTTNTSRMLSGASESLRAASKQIEKRPMCNSVMIWNGTYLWMMIVLVII